MKISEFDPKYEDAAGFFINYDVVADNPEEALTYIQIHLCYDGYLISIEEYSSLEPRPDSPKEVYWCSERIIYENEE